ncbi:hypothetical protein ACTWPT_58745 [Nonomuraea sp. 3N208]|uniref:hypothetical protein n=1 Tax=Nonomuraea sp. 3N208 TaxID=3457421 RepID=UPI003FD59121
MTHVLVVNVGGDTEEKSLEKATAYLRSRGWTVSVDGLPSDVFMESSKFKGANLALYTFSNSKENGHPEVMEAINQKGVRPGGLVSVAAYQGS